MIDQHQDQAQAREPVDVGERLWRHWIEWGLAAGVAVLNAGAWFPAALLPLWAAVAAGVLTGLIVSFSVLHFTASGRLTLVLAGWACTLTGWLAASRMVGVWHEGMLIGLTAPVAALIAAGASAQAKMRRTAQTAKPAVDPERPAREMTELLAAHGADVKVYKVMEHRGGRTYTGRISKREGKKPTSRAELEGTREGLASDLRLSEDQVQFERPDGGSAADFILHIQDKKLGVAETPLLPVENIPTSVTRPMALGIVLNTGKIFRALFREIHALVIGSPGSGKSNLLNVLIAQHSRCVDNVNFMIDFKGGKTGRAWITPWARKMCRRPVIDWLATTPEEARRMLTALNAARSWRSKHSTGEKIIPQAPREGDPQAFPQITLFIDEAAAATGGGRRTESEDGTTVTSSELAALLADLAEMGRSDAIAVIVCSVRGDATAIGTTRVKVACKLRIGLAVTQTSESGSIFPDHQKAAAVLASIRQLGAGLVLNLMKGAKLSPVIHFYRLTDGTVDEATMEATVDRITPIALDCGDNIVPALDEGTAEAMGAAYAERWTRPHGEDLKAQCRGADVLEVVETGDAEFDRIIAEIPDPDAKVDPRHERIRELLMERGFQGATPNWLFWKLLEEGMGASRETIQRWLKRDLTADPPLLRKDARIASKPRYTWIRR